LYKLFLHKDLWAMPRAATTPGCAQLAPLNAGATPDSAGHDVRIGTVSSGRVAKPLHVGLADGSRRVEFPHLPEGADHRVRSAWEVELVASVHGYRDVTETVSVEQGEGAQGEGAQKVAMRVPEAPGGLWRPAS